MRPFSLFLFLVSARKEGEDEENGNRYHNYWWKDQSKENRGRFITGKAY